MPSSLVSCVKIGSWRKALGLRSSFELRKSPNSSIDLVRGELPFEEVGKINVVKAAQGARADAGLEALEGDGHHFHFLGVVELDAGGERALARRGKAVGPVVAAFLLGLALIPYIEAAGHHDHRDDDAENRCPGAAGDDTTFVFHGEVKVWAARRSAAEAGRTALDTRLHAPDTPRASRHGRAPRGAARRPARWPPG